MWRSSLDPYITPLPTTSPAFLPILFQMPGFTSSIHISLYLPTAGKDPEFISSLSLLDSLLEDLMSTHSCPIYIRGDANCNPNNKNRSSLFQHFLDKHKLQSINFGHNSHHHFTGAGLQDAQLDVLLHHVPQDSHQPPQRGTEVLTQLICKLNNPLVDSAHDVVLSECSLPAVISQKADSAKNITAPKVDNRRMKVIWSDDDIPYYEALLV